MQKHDGSFTKKQREMMLLSHETRTGLRLTGTYIHTFIHTYFLDIWRLKGSVVTVN